MSELLAQPTLEPNAQLFRGVAVIPIENTLPQPEPQYAAEAPAEVIEPHVPRYRAAETLSLRERFTRSGFGRTALRVAMVAGLIAGPALANAAPAAADSQEYTITDDAAGGVFSRNSPHTNDTPRIVGKGVYPGDKVRLICGVTDGDPVGPYSNRTWHKIVNETRPDQGEFWENDHLFNTPNKANELAPGERNCNDTPPAINNSAPEVKGCYYNMKAPSTNLTFSYEGNHRYYGNAWQAAKNWSDLGAGITIKPGDGDTYIKFKDVYAKNAGWYAKAMIPAEVDWQGHMQGKAFSNYTVPPPTPHTPSSVTIEVNQWAMDEYKNKKYGTVGLNDFLRTYALGHEIGHALGLAHPDNCGVNDKSIEHSGGEDVQAVTFNKPQHYDKLELEQLYGLPRQ